MYFPMSLRIQCKKLYAFDFWGTPLLGGRWMYPKPRWMFMEHMIPSGKRLRCMKTENASGDPQNQYEFGWKGNHRKG